MAGTTLKKQDLNRLTKSYPFVRREPRYRYIADQPTRIESGTATFSGTDTATATFAEAYSTAPTVTASPLSDDIVVYVESVSTAGVTFRSSAPTSATVHFHVIRIG